MNQILIIYCPKCGSQHLSSEEETSRERVAAPGTGRRIRFNTRVARSAYKRAYTWKITKKIPCRCGFDIFPSQYKDCYGKPIAPPTVMDTKCVDCGKPIKALSSDIKWCDKCFQDWKKSMGLASSPAKDEIRGEINEQKAKAEIDK